MSRLLKRPSNEEDAAITAAALSDPDALPLTDAEWHTIQPTIRRGRPTAQITKERITIRLSRDVVEKFRSTGPGWQSRIDAALNEWTGQNEL